MKKTRGLFWILTGAMLFLSALFLVVYNFKQDSKSGQVASEILSELKEIIPQTTEPVTEPELPLVTIKNDLFSEYENDLFSEYEETTIATEVIEEKTIEIDGSIYIGIIWIPSLNLELPVLSNWSYSNLNYSPCRYEGTVQEGNLIIAAHNYRSHFGNIQNLNIGDQIIFTDVNGITYEYEVILSELIDGYDIESMEFGSADDWDLTLFTCTLSGQSRVTVRAVEVKLGDD